MVISLILLYVLQLGSLVTLNSLLNHFKIKRLFILILNFELIELFEFIIKVFRFIRAIGFVNILDFMILFDLK